MLNDLDAAPVDSRLKPIFRYARKLTETPSRLTEADVTAVYDVSWSDEALLHAIAVCASFNNTNRLVEGSGIIGTLAGYEIVAKQLFEHGYLKTHSTSSAHAPRRPQYYHFQWSLGAS